jgi:hypothetical protein
MANPLGSTPGIIVGVGVGAAAAAAIEPIIEPARQQAWHDNPFKLLDSGTLARLVAQGGIELGDAQTEARLEGISADKLNALVYLAQTVPGWGQLLELFRRGRTRSGGDSTFRALFEHALTKNGLDQRYLPPLESLSIDRLDPAVIANAIVRGLMDPPFDLPQPPPSEVGKIKAFPKSSLDAEAEALAHGIDRDRLFVMTAIDGRPMSPEGAASATFRNIIERVDYDRAISEGDVRNEWADAIFDASRQIPTAHDYVEGKLRNWIGTDEMNAGAARHGMTEEDTNLLFLISGRPIAYRQVFIGLRRGGVYDGPTDAIPQPALKSMQESNIRPEWYNLAWAQRYTYPSAFVLRALTQAGDITGAQAHDILMYEGWDPDLAASVSKAWSTGGGTSAKSQTKAELLAEYEGGYIDEAEYRTALAALGYSGQALDLEVELGNARLAKRYRDAIVKAIHDAYMVVDIDDAEARAELLDAGLTADGAARMLTLWAKERRVYVRNLTPAQIAKAYKAGRMDLATATTRLENLGYSSDDAATLLAE